MTKRHYAPGIFRNFCLCSALAVAMASCSSDEQLYGESNDAAITFTSSATRVSGSEWEAGDAIGVFMTNSGEWTTPTGVQAAANAHYTTATAAGVFSAATTSDILKYPGGSAAAYDFTAYYPYSATTTADGVVKVNVSDQSKPAAIDLLYSDNAKAQTSNVKSPALQFTHKLAKVVLNITSKDGKDISNLKATVLGQPATADFNLKAGSFANVSTTATDIPMYTTGSGTTLTATAFLIPQTTLSGGLKVRLASADGSKQKDITLTEVGKLESGKTVTSPITVSNIGGEEPTVKYEHYSETPLITYAQLNNQNLQYVRHYLSATTRAGGQVRNYSMLYDKQLKVAYWVAYPLCRYYTQKNTSRTDDWGIYDPDVEKQYQANLLKSYQAADYDRGHQIPSADRLVSDEANSQTFYPTNVAPQKGKAFNRNVWASLEGNVRSWATNGNDTLFVVTGVGFYDKNNINYVRDIDGKQIAKPDYFYKALLDYKSGSTEVEKMIAFKFDNKDYATDKNGQITAIKAAALSVAELEKITGFTFFPGVSEADKQTFDISKWYVTTYNN